MKSIVTSESVNIGHPDKTCDYISDLFLDEALRQDPQAQMAVECAIKSNLLMIYGESTTTAQINYAKIARQALKEIGYKNRFKIIQKITQQSPDIHQAVVKNHLCANDQGMVYGYATNETVQYMPLPILLAHELMKQYEQFRRLSDGFFADAKSQVSVVYEHGQPVAIDTIVLSVSHDKEKTHEDIELQMKQFVIEPVLQTLKNVDISKIRYLINPSGKFTIWGSFSDSGCVGRKIVVDTYGGVGRVGGGCFSSKNATKVDRSGAYYARYIAKNIVANGLADRCEIQIGFAIGQENPVSISLDCFGTEKKPLEDIMQIVKRNFSFKLEYIISKLNLLSPIYAKTACWGHFGRDEFSWEKIIPLK